MPSPDGVSKAVCSRACARPSGTISKHKLRGPAKQAAEGLQEQERELAKRLHRLNEDTHRLEAAEKAARKAKERARKGSAGVTLEELEAAEEKRQRAAERRGGGGAAGGAPKRRRRR